MCGKWGLQVTRASSCWHPALTATIRELDSHCCFNVTCRLVVQVVDVVLCVVAFMGPHNCCVQSGVQFHFFYSVIVTLVSACVCCLSHVGACFVNMDMALDHSFLDSEFSQLYFKKHLSISLHMFVLMSNLI